MLSLASMVLPGWAKYAAMVAAAFSIWLLGDLHGHKVAGEAHNEYVMKQAAQTVAIVKKQTKVVIQTETVYRDRIQKIYVKGAQIENSIPSLVPPADDAKFAVSAGFLRVLDAAWAGDTTGPAAESDHEPAGVPISEIATSEARNATSCHAWREQALRWRKFYADQQTAINGTSPTWYHE